MFAELDIQFLIHLRYLLTDLRVRDWKRLYSLTVVIIYSAATTMKIFAAKLCVAYCVMASVDRYGNAVIYSKHRTSAQKTCGSL